MSIGSIKSGARALQGKTVLVTGGASGIGKAICQRLAAEGARICIADLNRAAAETLAAGFGAGHMALHCDVTRADSVAAAFNDALGAFGALDIVCANAGVSTMNRVSDLSESEWDLNMDVNAKGVFLTDQAAVRHWLGAKRPGVIVNTCSVGGKMGAPLLAHYCASKFAVLGFTQSLAKEVARDGIRVNCVCPGFVRTAMQAREAQWEGSLRGMTPEAVLAEYVSLTPMGRLEEPEDVAEAVLFLAGDGARFIAGEALNVSGGAFMD